MPGRGTLEFCGWSVFFCIFRISLLLSILAVLLCIPTDGVGMFSYFHAMFNIYCLETFGGWPHSLVGGDTSWLF